MKYAGIGLSLASKPEFRLLKNQLLDQRQRVDDAKTHELGELIQEGRIVLMGAVRQELLSEIKLKAQFELLREHLRCIGQSRRSRRDGCRKR